MDDHLPECPVEKRLRTGKTVGSQACICGALRTCEERVLGAAREAVEAIPAPYKVKGQYETYGSYNEGRADFQDLCLSAINALREKQ